MPPRASSFLKIAVPFAAVLSGLLCGLSAYQQYEELWIAALFLTGAVTAQIIFQQVALASTRHWLPPVIALAVFAAILTPYDVAGLAARQTLLAAAGDDTKTIADEADQIARVVRDIRSKTDRLASAEQAWRKRAVEEAAGQGLSGNGGGHGAVYGATLFVADELKSVIEVLNSFLAVAEANSKQASDRVHALRTLTADKKQDLLSVETETVFRKRRIAAEDALNKIVASSEITALQNSVMALDTLLSGAPSTDLSERERERQVLRDIHVQATILGATLRDIQLALETEMPTEVSSYSPSTPFARILKYPESAAPWLAVGAALHLGQILALLLLIRRRDEEEAALNPLADDKPALRAV